MKNERVMTLLARLDRLADHVQNERRLSVADLDDVRQEMAVALLMAPDGLSDEHALRRAVWRALDWVRRERQTRRKVRPCPFEELIALIDSGQCRRVWC